MVYLDKARGEIVHDMKGGWVVDGFGRLLRIVVPLLAWLAVEGATCKEHSTPAKVSINHAKVNDFVSTFMLTLILVCKSSSSQNY